MLKTRLDYISKTQIMLQAGFDAIVPPQMAVKAEEATDYPDFLNKLIIHEALCDIPIKAFLVAARPCHCPLCSISL